MERGKRTKTLQLIIDGLPNEIAIDILSRVPASTLHQCKRVSKSWRDLISSDLNFRCMPHQRSQQNRLFLYLGKTKDFHGEGMQMFVNKLCIINPHGETQIKSDFNLFYLISCNPWNCSNANCPNTRNWLINYPPYGPQYCGYLVFKDKEMGAPQAKVLGVFKPEFPFSFRCCGGLICFGWSGSGEIYVANPSTNDLAKLPESRPVYYFYLGYIPSRNEYKVISFYKLVDDYPIVGCEILTLRDREGVDSSSWKHIGYFHPEASTELGANFRELGNTCIDGIVYWMIWIDEGLKLACLDLEDETYREVNFPEVCRSGVVLSSFQVVKMKGDLCLVGSEDSSYGYAVTIWKLEDELNSIWVEQFSSFLVSTKKGLPPYLFQSPLIRDDEIMVTKRKNVSEETKKADMLILYDKEEPKYYNMEEGYGIVYCCPLDVQVESHTAIFVDSLFSLRKS